jgi:hypothetical protein
MHRGVGDFLHAKDMLWIEHERGFLAFFLGQPPPTFAGWGKGVS